MFLLLSLLCFFINFGSRQTRNAGVRKQKFASGGVPIDSDEGSPASGRSGPNVGSPASAPESPSRPAQPIQAQPEPVHAPPAPVQARVVQSGAAGPSSAAGSSTDPKPPDCAEPQKSKKKITAWIALLTACFDNKHIQRCGPPQNAEFVISAKEGKRETELTFLVNAFSDGKGYRCKLEWDESIIPCGKIVSTTDGEPTDRRVLPIGPMGFSSGLLWAVTGITIDIYGGTKPHWELTQNQPNNLVTNDFLKSFLAQGLAEHMRYIDEKPVYLRMSDNSALREIYWLLKANGFTFLQGTWSMEYECMLSRLNPSQRQAFYTASRSAHSTPANALLTSRNYNPIKNALSWENPVRYFSDFFKEEMDEFYPEGRDFGTMTAHEVIKLFIEHWKSKKKEGTENPKYTAGEQIRMAQDTFVYFFRNHQNFELIARQVLSGYDDACIFMAGRPIETAGPMPFDYEYRPRAQNPPPAQPRRAHRQEV